jgi:hypothetical protein
LRALQQDPVRSARSSVRADCSSAFGDELVARAGFIDVSWCVLVCADSAALDAPRARRLRPMREKSKKNF